MYIIVSNGFCCSIRPNIYVGVKEGSSMYKKWYFEVVVTQFEAANHLPPTLRVGWANTEGFIPYPGGGEHRGGNGIGDDLYSYAYDGVNLWTGQFTSSYMSEILIPIEYFATPIYVKRIFF